MFVKFIATTVGLAMVFYAMRCLNLTSLLLFVAYISVVMKATFHLEYSGKGPSADAGLAVIDSSPFWAMMEIIVHPLRYGLLFIAATYLYIQGVNHFIYV